MGKYLGSTGLTYLWGKIKSIFATKTELAGHPTGRIYYGTCSTTANTYVKEATVETFPLDEDDKPLVGTVVAIKYSVTNTYKTEGQTYALNVNNTGTYPMYYNNAAVATSTSANTLAAGYKNRHVFYVFNGTQWVWLSASYDTNTTYSGMTQAEVDAGTGTTARLITPARLRDNFYTEGEVDTLLGSKANSNDLATVATSGSYNDLDDTPPIPATVTESTVSGWGFTKNTGTYSKPSGGIPKSDLADAVQTSLGKADTALQSFTESDPTVPSHVKGITTTDISNWNGKQTAIADLSDIRSGAALGATALQSYTETDPTVPAWAKAANKPSYTAAEVGALPDSTTIPSASTSTPQMDGTGAAGSASTYAKGDHVHPSDTSREARVTTVSHGTNDTTFALTPNVLHTWGTINSLTLTLASGSSTYVDGYWFKFTAGSSFTTLTMPSGVVWVAEPEIEAGKTYEVMIVNNLATYITEGIYDAYATKQWVQENIHIPSISIVASSGSTITANVNTIYTYSTAVTNLAITLPAITDTTKAEAISFILTTGVSPNITFSSANNTTILYHDGYSFEDSTMYELNAMFVGSAWIIGMCKIATT